MFEGVTDPQGKGKPASVPIGQGPRVTTKPKMTPPVTTRVFQIPENWNWEDTPQAAEALRTNGGYSGIVAAFEAPEATAAIEAAIGAPPWASGHYA